MCVSSLTASRYSTAKTLLFTSTKRSEVLCRLRNYISKELQHQSGKLIRRTPPLYSKEKQTSLRTIRRRYTLCNLKRDSLGRSSIDGYFQEDLRVQILLELRHDFLPFGLPAGVCNHDSIFSNKHPKRKTLAG